MEMVLEQRRVCRFSINKSVMIRSLLQEFVWLLPS